MHSALRKADIQSFQINTTNDKKKVRVENPTSWTVYFCQRMKYEFQAIHDIHVIWERRRATLARYEARLRSGEEGLSHPFHPKNACGRNAILIKRLTEKETKAAFRLNLAE